MISGDRNYWMKRTFALWRDTDLPRVDRLDFAGKVLGRDVETFADLDAPDLTRLVDGLEGWHAIDVLRMQRGSVGPYGPGVTLDGYEPVEGDSEQGGESSVPARSPEGEA